MSKAFTREEGSSELAPPARAPLPAGTRNYITRQGADRIQSELAQLLQHKRQLAESSTEEQEQKALEARIQHLQSLVASFVVVDPAASDVVRFGATVRLRRGSQIESYTIVGVDEIDLEKNHISWLSPLARALLSHRCGARVAFKSPAGTEQLEILAIE